MVAQRTHISAAILALVACLISLPYASAQPLPLTDPSPNNRDQLYAELAREAEALDRYFGLLKRIIRVVKPTVVHIEAKRKEYDNYRRSRQVEEAGSGTILRLNEKYYVLTNRHVINKTELRNIDIKLTDGRVTHPVKVWSDPGTDVAVMEMAEMNLTSARIGDSAKLEIGEFVLAVGSPFGLSHSVTYGIISAKGRRDLELGKESVRYQDFVQTDAAINPGNSGGPLINLRGEVVGMNTAIASSSGGNEGIGFTIPINMATIIAKQLIANGRVIRAFFGVHLDSKFSAEMAAQLGLPRLQGARVSGITANSPAEAAEIKVGDVILKFNNVEIEDDNDLVNRVSLTPVDSEVPIAIFREGKQIELKATVGDRRKFSNQ